MGNLQQLSQITRDSACHSELWYPTLQLLLAYWVDPVRINVRKLFEGVDPTSSNATAVRQVSPSPSLRRYLRQFITSLELSCSIAL